MDYFSHYLPTLSLPAVQSSWLRYMMMTPYTGWFLHFLDEYPFASTSISWSFRMEGYKTSTNSNTTTGWFYCSIVDPTYTRTTLLTILLLVNLNLWLSLCTLTLSGTLSLEVLHAHGFLFRFSKHSISLSTLTKSKHDTGRDKYTYLFSYIHSFKVILKVWSKQD